MKIFKFIVVSILTLITIQTAYLALLYKVQIATGTFLICLGITLFVACNGGLEKRETDDGTGSWYYCNACSFFFGLFLYIEFLLGFVCYQYSTVGTCTVYG